MPRKYDDILLFPPQSSVVRLDTLVKISNQAKEHREKDLLFDLSRVEQLSPILLCILTATITECAGDFKNKIFIKYPRSRRAADILRKLDYQGQTPGRLESQFLQVRRLTKDGVVLISDVVALIGENLRLSRGVTEMMRVLYNELFSNAIEHSGRSTCYVCAGRWGRSKHVHISIVDFGVGMPAKLRTKFFAKIGEDDLSAIALALSGGVTTRENGRGGLGYGVIQDFLKANKGRLRIYSGKAKADYNFARSEYIISKKRDFFSGTCVDIQINKDKDNRYKLLGENEEYYF